MAWYDEARFYHIYPLGLLDAPRENSYDKPVHRIKELDKWIDHVLDINCNAIYIGPLFESVGHGYETTDYKKLDSRLGTNDDLKAFVKKCHKKNVRVIFDGVFNHVGRDFFAFKDLQANRENSRYRDWFCNVNFYSNNEYNDGFSYDNWGGYNLLVKLNQRNPEVKDFICDVIRFWVKEFDVDGIRLDAADVLDFDFMKCLRAVANEVKPEFWLMGEVIHGDYTRWVNEGTLHSVTNYTLHKALYSGHNDHNYFEIAHTVQRLNDMSGNNTNGLKLYNFTDNHDVERIISKIYNKDHYFPIHILLYTLPGIPSIYYGSEFAIEGKKEKGSDASIRPAINLDDYKDASSTNRYTKFIKILGEIRKGSPELSYGNYRQISLTNRQYMFARELDGRAAIVAVNNDDAATTIYGNNLIDGEYTGAITGNKYTVSGGNISVNLGPNSGDIILPDSDKIDLKLTEFDMKAASEVPQKVETVAEVEEAKPESKVQPEPKTEPELEPKAQPENKVAQIDEEKPVNGAGNKYGIGDKYNTIDPDIIRSRNDYDNMSIEELQVAILEKMAANGPVNDQMIRTVMDNVYLDSLKNWVKSFR